MKRIVLLLLFLAITNAYPQNNSITGFLSTEGDQIITAEGEPIILKGTNLGNWLLPEGYMWKLDTTDAHWQIITLTKAILGPDAALKFWKKWYDTYITQEDIQYLSNIGVNFIRVPFNYRLFSPEDHPDIWLETGFHYIDKVVKWAREENIYLLLDMHAAPGGQTGTNIDDSYGYPWLFVDEDSQKRFIDVWCSIAEYYKDEPVIMGYGLLNEPLPHFKEYEQFYDDLEPLYKRAVAEIRKIDTNHIIVLGGCVWNTNFKHFGEPFDDNVVYEFHKYWMDPVQKEIQEYLDFREKYNVPIFMGESGENTHEWINSFRTLLDEHSIHWTFWPYKRMDSDRCIRTFDKPEQWEKVREYATTFFGEVMKIRERRPPFAELKKGLESLLENISFKSTYVNDGYVKALGF